MGRGDSEIEFKPAITGAAPRFAIVTGGFHTLEGLYLVDSINCASGPTVGWVDLQRPSEYRVIYWNVGSFCPWDSRLLRASGSENAPQLWAFAIADVGVVDDDPR